MKRQDLTTLQLKNVIVLPEWIRADNGGTKWKLRCKVHGLEFFSWAEVIKRTPDICCKLCRNEIVRKARTSHGGRYTKEYQARKNAQERCDNPKHHAYALYGGKGIKICQGFRDYPTFIRIMGKCPPGLTLDRFPDKHGNYSCGQCDECKAKGWLLNCMWRTMREQGNNRCNNICLTAFGKTQTISEWARELGIDKSTILKRYRKGWPHEKCLSKSDFRC